MEDEVIPEERRWRRMTVAESIGRIPDLTLDELRRVIKHPLNESVLAAVQREIHTRENASQINRQFLIATGIAILALLVAIGAWLRPV